MFHGGRGDYHMSEVRQFLDKLNNWFCGVDAKTEKYCNSLIGEFVKEGFIQDHENHMVQAPQLMKLHGIISSPVPIKNFRCRSSPMDIHLYTFWNDAVFGGTNSISTVCVKKQKEGRPKVVFVNISYKEFKFTSARTGDAFKVKDPVTGKKTHRFTHQMYEKHSDPNTKWGDCWDIQKKDHDEAERMTREEEALAKQQAADEAQRRQFDDDRFKNERREFNRRCSEDDMGSDSDDPDRYGPQDDDVSRSIMPSPQAPTRGGSYDPDPSRSLSMAPPMDEPTDDDPYQKPRSMRSLQAPKRPMYGTRSIGAIPAPSGSSKTATRSVGSKPRRFIAPSDDDYPRGKSRSISAMSGAPDFPFDEDQPKQSRSARTGKGFELPSGIPMAGCVQRTESYDTDRPRDLGFSQPPRGYANVGTRGKVVEMNKPKSPPTYDMPPVPGGLQRTLSGYGDDDVSRSIVLSGPPMPADDDDHDVSRSIVQPGPPGYGQDRMPLGIPSPGGLCRTESGDVDRSRSMPTAPQYHDSDDPDRSRSAFGEPQHLVKGLGQSVLVLDTDTPQRKRHAHGGQKHATPPSRASKSSQTTMQAKTPRRVIRRRTPPPKIKNPDTPKSTFKPPMKEEMKVILTDLVGEDTDTGLFDDLLDVIIEYSEPVQEWLEHSVPVLLGRISRWLKGDTDTTDKNYDILISHYHKDYLMCGWGGPNWCWDYHEHYAKLKRVGGTIQSRNYTRDVKLIAKIGNTVIFSFIEYDVMFRPVDIFSHLCIAQWGEDEWFAFDHSTNLAQRIKQDREDGSSNGVFRWNNFGVVDSTM